MTTFENIVRESMLHWQNTITVIATFDVRALKEIHFKETVKHCKNDKYVKSMYRFCGQIERDRLYLLFSEIDTGVKRCEYLKYVKMCISIDVFIPICRLDLGRFF